jgi:hypothetical protein
VFRRNAESGEVHHCARFRGTPEIGKKAKKSRHLVLYNLAGFCTGGIKRLGVFCVLVLQGIFPSFTGNNLKTRNAEYILSSDFRKSLH